MWISISITRVFLLSNVEWNEITAWKEWQLLSERHWQLSLFLGSALKLWDTPGHHLSASSLFINDSSCYVPPLSSPQSNRDFPPCLCLLWNNASSKIGSILHSSKSVLSSCDPKPISVAHLLDGKLIAAGPSKLTSSLSRRIYTAKLPNIWVAF